MEQPWPHQHRHLRIERNRAGPNRIGIQRQMHKGHEGKQKESELLNAKQQNRKLGRGGRLPGNKSVLSADSHRPSAVATVTERGIKRRPLEQRLQAYAEVSVWGTPVPSVLGETTVEQSRDPSVQPSTELPLDYSRDPYKEEGMEQTGNTGVQEGEQGTWEMSGEPGTESTPNPSVEPSQEPTQESTTEISTGSHCHQFVLRNE
ncbi:hypothetical protein LUU34_00781900 [Aix galericulata]|nr:hypothetical protein LUU34_00781900 [Aix galericulata]